MNSGRFWLIAVALAGAATAAAVGCGGNAGPCPSCPAMEGRYTLEFASGPVPAECTSLGVGLPQGPLDIQRSGSQLNATLDSVEMQGSVQPSAEFNLLGNQTDLDGGTHLTQFSLNGTYTPGKPDGGAGQISGLFTGTYTRPSAQGTSHCSIPRAYTATQQR